MILIKHKSASVELGQCFFGVEVADSEKCMLHTVSLSAIKLVITYSVSDKVGIMDRPVRW